MRLSLSESETEEEEGEREKAMTTTSSGTQTVKVLRTKLTSCLTCPLCHDFFRDATTISECLHTFCKDCIYRKLIEEFLRHCPVCKVDLCCTPLDKLRPDHNLQDLREKLFPNEGKSAKEKPAYVPPFPLPTRRKERSLSSLGANPSKLSSHSSIFARRAKAVAKNACAGKEPAQSLAQPDKASDGKKDERNSDVEILEEVPKNLSRAKAAARRKIIPREFIPSTSQPDQFVGNIEKDQQQSELQTKNVMSGVKNSSELDLSHQVAPNEIPENNAELCKGKTNNWEPFNYLMEAVRKTKQTESIMQQNAVIALPPPTSCDNDSRAPAVQVKNKIIIAGDQNDATPVQPDCLKTKRLRSTQQRRVRFAQDLNLPAVQPAVESNSKSNKRPRPMWFSLVASEEKEVHARLPQIPSCYIRVNDGSLPVSFIKRYIMKKLNLASEAEVEISLQGKPVLSSMQLQNLIEMWLETVPRSEKIQSYVGSSAKDFVMVLSYGRRVVSS